MAVRVRGGVAGLAGLATCGSVWADPVCSAKILARRGLEIGAMLTVALADGYTLGLVTLTEAHFRTQALAELWGAAGVAWGKATTGSRWAAACKRSGVVGWVRVWEVTEGVNGWHVHVHAVVVLGPGADASALEDVAGGMFGRWARSLERSGLRKPLRIGQDWHLVAGEAAGSELAEYLSKLGLVPEAVAGSLGLELTHTQPGRTRAATKTRPVWSLHQDYAQAPSKALLRRIHEWEQVSKGRRQIGYSAGFRDLFGVSLESTDEEIAAEEMGSASDDLVVILAGGWARMVAQPSRIRQLLDAAEVGGLHLVRALLDEWGDVPYVVA